ncbi:MAG: hypothetical protein AseanaTS_25900 [Candidatus Pelagadaptatus aseana]|uniref:GspH/FimT family pseudopilin n=1 Tax=Candidatus Pelagadaptatus aseana TaxID=3120508 RepID=UPI0039B2EA98
MKQRGFTLIELMVTVVVLAILVTVALPGFNTMIDNQRIQSTQRTMLSAINLARSEATHRNQTVTIASAGGADWEDGISIYTDNDAGGNTAFTGADTLIKDISGAISDAVTVRTDGNAFISFQGNGMLNEAGNTVTMAICDERGPAFGRAINISRVGRASVSTDIASCTP